MSWTDPGDLRRPGVGRAARPSRRDRRGRGVRGPLAWPAVPVMATRSEHFDELVIESASRLEEIWGRPFPPVEFGVEDVPPSDPAPWEHAEVPLGRLFGAEGRSPARVVIYRRPVETRAVGRRELATLVADVVTEQVAALLGVAPEQLDPGYDDLDD
ncbi:metallopeptidase family protein [Lapillicoccus sp.]|uniref:metallopeptidase family protein n=1 Tax=Lapillicoccus sp. TaxID=1909287 RepID=UPI0027CAD7E2|nr:metallopeptidase family protein [Actinomycetota bacterium]